MNEKIMIKTLLWSNLSQAPLSSFFFFFTLALALSSVLSPFSSKWVLSLAKIPHPWYLTKFLIPFPVYVITLACFQQESCQVSLTKMPPPSRRCFLLVNFPSTDPYHACSMATSLSLVPTVFWIFNLLPYFETPL